MSRIEAIRKRVDRIQRQIVPHQQEQEDEEAMAIIRATLLRKLQVRNPDGTLPDDFADQCRRIDQEQTPEERAMVVQYSRRHPSTGAREELLARLSRGVKEGQTEDSGQRE